MKTVKKIQLETNIAGNPRLIEFELPAYIQTKDIDAYVKGVTDLLETLEANTQSHAFDNILRVISNKGVFVDGE